MSAMVLFQNNFQVDSANDTHFTGNDVCPVGYFCPNGTDYPFPCPRGTFSNVEEVTDVDGCEPCPPGRYCNVSAYTVTSEAPMCDPGLVHTTCCFYQLYSLSSIEDITQLDLINEFVPPQN